MSIAFEDVSFHYGSALRPGALVFDGFTWTAPTGRTILLGPNGAGKSTLLSLAATVLRPRSGRIVLDGRSSQSDRGSFRRSIALMPQGSRAIPGFTASEQVAYAAWLRGAPSSEAAAAAGVALERVGLDAKRDDVVSTLSGGQQRRVALAQALVMPARILLLDEPTAGLDPAQRTRFRQLISDLPDDLAVIVSTHQVDDLDELFERVVVLAQGRVRFEGTTHEFMSLSGPSSARPAEDAYLSLLGSEV